MMTAMNTAFLNVLEKLPNNSNDQLSVFLFKTCCCHIRFKLNVCISELLKIASYSQVHKLTLRNKCFQCLFCLRIF